ncbi:MAG: type II toxin-antitoxin system HipA family toxin [Gallionella sp.]|nr:type II toxin-antitoxin system HipA family toxin [Gallionella sp.]
MTVQHELAVWLFAERVGTLTWQAGQLAFGYTDEWLQQADAVPLSVTLPLRIEAFDDAATRPFFAGLLPEGRLRDLIAQQFHLSRQNDFALLDQLGGECAGAVSLLPFGAALPVATQAVDWLDEAQLLALLDELPRRPMLAGKDGLRLSLAGAQDKLPVVVQGERIGLPRAGTPSTHILKPAIAGVEDSVVNEGFCLALAAQLKLHVARAQIYPLQDQHFLLVERYDRLHTGEAVQRLHQEDFCQALGYVPEMKYQNEGGPNLAQCFDLLRLATRPSVTHVLRLLDNVIFNALIGNHDAHAKNFSLLYQGKSASIAPLYDTLCTAIYPNLSPKMAMKLGSKYRYDDVFPRHWDQFASDAGLSKAQTRKRVQTLASALPPAARQLQTDPRFVASPVVEAIVQFIEQRAEMTLRRLRGVEAM